LDLDIVELEKSARDNFLLLTLSFVGLPIIATQVCQFTKLI